MKVELIESPKQQEITYPCLMVGHDRVLFVTEKRGVWLKGWDMYDGEYSDNWNGEIFKPYTGKVVLSNE